MLLGAHVLLMRYYNWRKWATLLDSRVPNNHDMGSMPDAYYSSFTSPSSILAEDRTWILSSICKPQFSLGSESPPILPTSRALETLSRRLRRPWGFRCIHVLQCYQISSRLSDYKSRS